MMNTSKYLGTVTQLDLKLPQKLLDKFYAHSKAEGQSERVLLLKATSLNI